MISKTKSRKHPIGTMVFALVMTLSMMITLIRAHLDHETLIKDMNLTPEPMNKDRMEQTLPTTTATTGKSHNELSSLTTATTDVELDDPTSIPTLYQFHTDIDSISTSVTLFTNHRASVERTFKVKPGIAEATSVQVTLTKLSQHVDTSSFSVSAVIQDENSKDHTTITQLFLKETQFEQEVPISNSKEKAEKEALEEDLKPIELKLQDMEQLKNGILRESLSSKFDTKEFTEKMQALKELEEIISQLSKQKRDISKKIEQLNSKPTPWSFLPYNFTFSATLPKHTVHLIVKYIVTNETSFNTYPLLTWIPYYSLHIDSKKQTGRLVFMADLQQYSGENWTNAQITLSTDTLTLAPSLPQVQELTLAEMGVYLDGNSNRGSWLNDLTLKNTMTVRSAVNMNYAPQSESFGQSQNNDDQFQSPAQVKNNPLLSTSIMYVIAGRLTLPSAQPSMFTPKARVNNNVIKKVLIGQVMLETQWFHKVIPKQTTKVYTNMSIKNKSKLQLVPGAIDIFVDNMLTSQTTIDKNILPKQTFNLDTGIDKMVSVTVLEKSSNEDYSGWFQKTKMVKNLFKVLIDNKKDVPINITVMDALPKITNWHKDKSLKILLTQPKLDGKPESDLSEWFTTSNTKSVNTVEPLYLTFKDNDNNMLVKIKKLNYVMEREFTLKPHERKILSLEFVVSYTERCETWRASRSFRVLKNNALSNSSYQHTSTTTTTTMPLLLMGPLREFCQLIMAEPAKLLDMNFLATQYHQKFRLTMDETFLMKQYTNVLPITSVIVYLFIVFVLPKLLPVPAKDAKRPILKMVMFLWNMFLSVFSLAMLLGAAIPWFSYLKNEYEWDLPALICEDKHVLGPEQGLPHIVWAYIFALSKYLELIDTVLLVIKHPDRKVPFLHWFHHLTVLLFTWYAVYTQYAVGYCFIIMNALIHTFMYYYYALTELGYRPSWNFLLTVGQISQMIFGIVFNSIFAYKFFKNKEAGLPLEKNCRCEAPYEIMLSCVAMYGAYLYLFVDFFVRKYFGSAPAATSGKKKHE